MIRNFKKISNFTCKTEVGKIGDGYEVNQSLKFSLVFLGSGESSSHIFSKLDIQVVAK